MSRPNANPSQSAAIKAGAGESLVYVIDDDDLMRRALGNLLRSVGLSVKTFESSQEFLACPVPDGPSCLILDVRLRGENGLVFQSEMARMGLQMPVVIITAHGDIEMTVKAMKAGATDFLAKPYREQDLLDAVLQALAKDQARLAVESSANVIRDAYNSLTSREREVVELILAGLLNKQIASKLNITETTVKKHRGQAMHKLSARTAADLVGKVRSLGIEPRAR
jgi:FixJ family two-component response regulator